MMDELLKTALSQTPSLVVLYFLVTLFLKRDRERDLFIHQLHAEHLAARGESRDAIRENTESNKAVTQAIGSLADAVTRQTLSHNQNQ